MATAPAVSPVALKRKTRRKSRTLPIVITTALIGGLGWFGWTKTHPAEDTTGKLLTAPVTKGDLVEAQAAVRAAQARQAAAAASATQQGEQTPQDVKRAQNALSVSRAALSTAQSNLKQVQASVNLQIATAQESLTQAQATYKNSAA